MAHIESAAAVVLFGSVHKKNRCGKLQTQIVPKQSLLPLLSPSSFFPLNNNHRRAQPAHIRALSQQPEGVFGAPRDHPSTRRRNCTEARRAGTWSCGKRERQVRPGPRARQSGPPSRS
ncbi:Hypothetical predicted protein, partial [Marmota monax]